MTIVEALYRELRFGLCGAGGALSGIVAGDHVKQDMRNAVSSTRPESDYPWLIFRSVTDSENNQVKYDRERIEIEAVGLRSSAAKGEDTLRQVRDALKDHFGGKVRTIGKYTSAGVADPSGGLKVKSVYLSTVEGYSEDLKEKSHVLLFAFAYVRA